MALHHSTQQWHPAPRHGTEKWHPPLHHTLCQTRNHGPLLLEVGTRIALAIWVNNCAVMGGCVESNSLALWKVASPPAKEENGSSHPLSEPGSMLGLWRFTRSFSRLQCLVPAVPRPPSVQHSSRSKELSSRTHNSAGQIWACALSVCRSTFRMVALFFSESLRLVEQGWYDDAKGPRIVMFSCSAVSFQDVQRSRLLLDFLSFLESETSQHSSMELSWLHCLNT